MKINFSALIPLFATAVFCSIAFRDVGSWNISFGLALVIINVGTAGFLLALVIVNLIATVALAIWGTDDYHRAKRNEYLVRLVVYTALSAGFASGYVLTVNSGNTEWLTINYTIFLIGMAYVAMRTLRDPSWLLRS